MAPQDLPKYQAISLSRRTVARRNQDVALDTEEKLKERIQTFRFVSLALDKSTYVSDVAQLAVFMRGVDANLEVTEELLELIPLKGTTTGEDIFKSVEECVHRMGVSWLTLKCVATDGARAMTGCNSGFVGRLRAKLNEDGIQNDVFAVHCLVHQETLCAKAFSLKNVMDVVVKCVNLIRAHGLNHRELRDFLESIDSEHTDIPYYSEVRWLSRGATLQRFFELREFVAEFVSSKGKPFPELKNPDWIADLAFLTDITLHLNELNVALQGRDSYIWNMSDEIQAFNRKLILWRSQLGSKNYQHFPRLHTLSESQDLHTDKYSEVITTLENQFLSRFAELLPLQDKFEMFVAPFNVDPQSAPGNLQLELIDLQCDTRLKNNYKETEDMAELYKRLRIDKFPNLRSFAGELIAMFGSTYAYEQFFSLMELSKPRLRARLNDTSLGAIMRLAAARSFQPKIDSLVREIRPQASSSRS